MSRPLPELLADLLVDRRHLARERTPFEDLAARVQGVVAEPGTAAYDALVGSGVEQHPAAALAARNASDVVEAVRFAGRCRLTVSPRATGDATLAGPAGELVVSTRALGGCVVRPDGWARVGAGVTWVALHRAAAAHGLTPVTGPGRTVVGDVTTGGLGPLARTYGLACDRVRALEAVTGDGELRRATPTEHPELFFALRGGTGALGVVTAVELDLVPQPEVHETTLRGDAGVLERWPAWSAQLPDQAGTSVLLSGGTAIVRLRWVGSPADAERALRALGASGAASWPEGAYAHAVLLRDLPPAVLRELRGSRAQLHRLGGALDRGSGADCSRAAWLLLVDAPWTGPRRPGTAGPSECYDSRSLARLQEAVRTYDPDGVLALGRAISR